MKCRIPLALLALSLSVSAGAEHWVEIARDDAPDGVVFYVDQDSLKVRRGIVFLRAQSRNRLTVTMSSGARYDYQIGEFAVNCKDKTMAGLGNAFYLKDGTLIGELPMDEDVIFTKGVVDKELFSEMGPADTPWAMKIIHACAWMKRRGKGRSRPSGDRNRRSRPRGAAGSGRYGARPTAPEAGSESIELAIRLIPQ